MKTILDQIDKGTIEIKCELGAGYVETQDLEGQRQRRESWKNALLDLARRGAKTLWIDINQERPKNQEIVDIYLENGSIVAGVIYNEETDGQGDAHFYEEDWDYVYDLSKVTHWMHPPAAPERIR